MVCEYATLLPPLMVGSIAGALLTLTGSRNLIEYIDELVKSTTTEGLVDVTPLGIKQHALVVALIFLASEIFLIGYIVIESGIMLFLSYCFFFTAILTIFVVIVNILRF